MRAVVLALLVIAASAAAFEFETTLERRWDEYLRSVGQRAAFLRRIRPLADRSSLRRPEPANPLLRAKFSQHLDCPKEFPPSLASTWCAG